MNILDRDLNFYSGGTFATETYKHKLVHMYLIIWNINKISEYAILIFVVHTQLTIITMAYDLEVPVM